MSWQFMLWIFAFILQAALLGKNMYVLITLSDLESDHTNPFDCCVAVNRLVVVEYLVQILLTGALILTQKWLLGAVHLAVTAYLIHIYLKRRLYMEAADAFRQLGKMKQWRLTVFVVYCLAFVFTTYRLVESIIHTVLTPEGRQTAKKLFQEAASSIHGF